MSSLIKKKKKEKKEEEEVKMARVIKASCACSGRRLLAT